MVNQCESQLSRLQVPVDEQSFVVSGGSPTPASLPSLSAGLAFHISSRSDGSPFPEQVTDLSQPPHPGEGGGPTGPG